MVQKHGQPLYTRHFSYVRRAIGERHCCLDHAVVQGIDIRYMITYDFIWSLNVPSIENIWSNLSSTHMGGAEIMMFVVDATATTTRCRRLHIFMTTWLFQFFYECANGPCH